MGRKLTPKQRCFVDEYLIDLNATQAAIRAGYKHPDIGRQLLTKTHVSHAIEKAMTERSERLEVTQGEVIGDLREIRDRCLQRIRPVMERGINGKFVQAKDENGNLLFDFDSNGATKAVELLGKHIGLFTTKIEHSGKITLAELAAEIPNDEQ